MGLTLQDEGPYHLETSPLIWRANQGTGFYVVVTSVMKQLNEKIGKYFDDYIGFIHITVNQRVGFSPKNNNPLLEQFHTFHPILSHTLLF